MSTKHFECPNGQTLLKQGLHSRCSQCTLALDDSGGGGEAGVAALIGADRAGARGRKRKRPRSEERPRGKECR